MVSHEMYREKSGNTYNDVHLLYIFIWKTILLTVHVVDFVSFDGCENDIVNP
jgi:hypothetical protein